jgi:hypothetical protein
VLALTHLFVEQMLDACEVGRLMGKKKWGKKKKLENQKINGK